LIRLLEIYLDGYWMQVQVSYVASEMYLETNCSFQIMQPFV